MGRISRTLITGASSGIGRALAMELARRGRRVVIAARRLDELERTAAEIRGFGGVADVERMDVADTTATVARLRELDDEREIDTVIANAGVGARPDADPSSWEALADACHVNYCGAAATLTALLPRMMSRSAAYCSPKAGLAMMLDCLRLDAASSGVTVTAVHLGFVDTPMLARSKHPMPQRVSAERAALVIADAIDGREDELMYPRTLGLAAKAAARLPRGLRSLLANVGARYR
jgi:short-subunit dehydrogenase